MMPTKLQTNEDNSSAIKYVVRYTDSKDSSPFLQDPTSGLWRKTQERCTFFKIVILRFAMILLLLRGLDFGLGTGGLVWCLPSFLHDNLW
jgi:hypothetical protein